MLAVIAALLVLAASTETRPRLTSTEDQPQVNEHRAPTNNTDDYQNESLSIARLGAKPQTDSTEKQQDNCSNIICSTLRGIWDWILDAVIVPANFFTLAVAAFTYLLYEVTKEQRRSNAQLERAYVFFRDTELLSEEHEPGFEGGDYRLIFENFGKTPAVVIRVRCGTGEFDSPPNPKVAPSEELPFGAIIGAGMVWPRGQVSIRTAWGRGRRADGGGVFLYGEIVYRDIFKNEQSSWFCRRWGGTQFVLADLTDEKLNGYT